MTASLRRVQQLRRNSRNYRRRVKAKALARLAEGCLCGQPATEMEHVKPTPTAGKGGGRGGDRRWREWLKYPECFQPMCHDCHRAIDGNAKKGMAQIESYLNDPDLPPLRDVI